MNLTAVLIELPVAFFVGISDGIEFFGVVKARGYGEITLEGCISVHLIEKKVVSCFRIMLLINLIFPFNTASICLIISDSFCI